MKRGRLTGQISLNPRAIFEPFSSHFHPRARGRAPRARMHGPRCACQLLPALPADLGQPAASAGAQLLLPELSSLATVRYCMSVVLQEAVREALKGLGGSAHRNAVTAALDAGASLDVAKESEGKQLKDIYKSIPGVSVHKKSWVLTLDGHSRISGEAAKQAVAAQAAATNPPETASSADPRTELRGNHLLEAFRTSLPYRTGTAIAGIGGVLKACAEHFVVKEVLDCEFAGQGEHVYIELLRQNSNTRDVMEALAAAFGVDCQAIGVAGLKDKHAVTQQHFSLPLPPSLSAAEIVSMASSCCACTVLGEPRRHTHKLRRGTNVGNHFTIVVSRVDELTAEELTQRVEAVATHLRSAGWANFYGRQRFGTNGESLRKGWRTLLGMKAAAGKSKKKRKRGGGTGHGFIATLSINALQSLVFNEVLAERMRSGDVLAPQQPAAGVVAPPDSTGPWVGAQMPEPASEAIAAIEQGVLQRLKLKISDFEEAGFDGGRRPLVLPLPQDFQAAPCEDGMRFEFTLPSGAYATSLLREFMKVDD